MEPEFEPDLSSNRAPPLPHRDAEVCGETMPTWGRAYPMAALVEGISIWK